MPPFDGSSVLEILYKHINVQPEVSKCTANQSAVPAELEQVLQKALAKDPADRYQSMREFRQELSCILQPPAKRVSVPLVGSVVALFLLLACILLWNPLTPNKPKSPPAPSIESFISHKGNEIVLNLADRSSTTSDDLARVVATEKIGEVISGSAINRLVLNGNKKIHDSTLNRLQTLKELRIIHCPRVTNGAIDNVRSARPDLDIIRSR